MCFLIQNQSPKFRFARTHTTVLNGAKPRILLWVLGINNSRNNTDKNSHSTQPFLFCIVFRNQPNILFQNPNLGFLFRAGKSRDEYRWFPIQSLLDFESYFLYSEQNLNMDSNCIKFQFSY